MSKITTSTPSAPFVDASTGRVNPTWLTFLHRLASSANTVNEALGITDSRVTKLQSDSAAAQEQLSGMIDENGNAINGVNGSVSTLAKNVGTLVIPTAEQAWGEHVTIDYADDRVYVVMQYAECDWTIDSVVARCAAGTCTATVAIDGVGLGGGANSVSTSETSVAHTTSNVVTTGQTITVTISSNAAAEGVAVSLVGRRTLANAKPSF